MKVYSENKMRNLSISISGATDEQINVLSKLVKTFAEAGSVEFSNHMGVASFRGLISEKPIDRMSFFEDLDAFKDRHEPNETFKIDLR